MMQVGAMKRIKPIILLLLALPCVATAMTSNDLNAKLQGVTDQYLTQNQQKWGFSAVEVSVLLPHEETPRNYVVGTQVKNSSEIATTNMLIQYGSITKEFTSTLILQLISQHKLTLQTTLYDIFPENTWAFLTF